MADETSTVRAIHWRDAFAFTHIFRSFRVAIHPSKLVLALGALLTLYIGGWALDQLWREKYRAVPDEPYLFERSYRGEATESFAESRNKARQRVEKTFDGLLTKYGILADSPDPRGLLVRQILQARENAADAIKASQDPAGIAQARQDYADATSDLHSAEAIRNYGLFSQFFTYEVVQVNGVIRGIVRWNWVGEGSVTRSLGNFFAAGPLWLMRQHTWFFALFTILFLTVWAVFGGAIARIAAIHVARDEKLSVPASLRFSGSKFLSLVSAPVIPMVLLLLAAGIQWFAGLLSGLPYVGPFFLIVTGLLFVLVLAAGFVIALILFGTLGGFNLMFPTIAVEGSDSFDAISRSFSYVYAKPWRMVFYTVVALVYGALTFLFVQLFLSILLGLTHYFVGAGMGDTRVAAGPLWDAIWSYTPARLSYDIDFATLRGDQKVAAAMIAFWVYLAIALLGAFAISFYFSANTIIYYLMRREVDATGMDDVYLEESEDEFAETAPPAETAPTSPTPQ